MDYTINHGQDFSQQIELRAKTVIKNIMIAIEASLGDRLDEKQKYIVRKVVLDNVNDLKSYSNAVAVFLISENTNKDIE